MTLKLGFQSQNRPPQGDSIIAFLRELPILAYELLVLVAKTWKPSTKKLFLLDSPYAYALLLCTVRDFDNSLFVVSEDFKDYLARGKVVFPGEVAVMKMRRSRTRALMGQVLWRLSGACLALVVRPLFNLRCKLFPMEVYLQEHPHLPAFSGVAHTYIHHGAGYCDESVTLYRRTGHLLWPGAIKNVKRFLLADGFRRFLKVPTTKVNFVKEVPKHLPAFIKAFPDLKKYLGEIKRYKKHGRTALLFGQAFAEGGFCSLATQKRVYDFLVDALRKSGYTVLIRPHPRDTLDYSPLETDNRVRVSRGYFPGEVAAALMPDVLLVGISSTTVEGIGRDARDLVFLGHAWLERHVGLPGWLTTPPFASAIRKDFQPVIRGDINKNFLRAVGVEVVGGRARVAERRLRLVA